MPKVTKINQLKKFKDSDFQYEEEKPKVKERYWVFPLLIEQLRSLKLEPHYTMQDAELNNFLSSVKDKEDFEKHVSHMIRLQGIDRLHGNKRTKKEFLIWYENWYGQDKSGKRVAPVSDLPHGLDKQIMYSTSYDEKGRKSYKVEDTYFVNTIEFSPEKVDEALEGCPDTQIENVAFSVGGIGRMYSGYSMEEFKHLSYEELIERGRSGNVSQPINNDILELQRKIKEIREREAQKKKQTVGTNTRTKK